MSMPNESEKPTGTSEESIGRPSEWREGRYEKPGSPVKPSVIKKPGEGPPDTTSTPVTEKDYQER